MKQIPLTRGYYAKVDDSDFDLVNRYKWFAVVHNGRVYAGRSVSRPNRRTIYMHTLITGFRLVDHIDHDGLNNQRVNLREASYSQNHANRRKTHGTSKYKGVYKRWPDKKWTAKIRHKGQSIYLGMYENEKDAALAYNKAAIEIFGAYANLNRFEDGVE